MLRVLFLILLAMSSFVFAQTEEKPKAYLSDEFETATNGYVKMKMDAVYTELNNNPTAQGYFINYGTPKDIAIREKQIKDAIRFRKNDASRITLVNGGFRGIVKTEFWIVPSGAESPQIETTARKIDELDKAYPGEIKAAIDSFYIELNNALDYKGYIVISGSATNVSTREKLIKNALAFRKYDLTRVTFIKIITKTKIKTEFWMDLSK